MNQYRVLARIVAIIEADNENDAIDQLDTGQTEVIAIESIRCIREAQP